jgi:hypothetical protein
MSTTTDYAHAVPYDWTWVKDAVLLTVVMFACGVVW